MRRYPIRVWSILIGMAFLALSFGRSGFGAEGVPGINSDKNAAQSIKAVDKYGFPVPADYTEYDVETGNYVHVTSVSSPSPLKMVFEMYRNELKARKWRELPGKPVVTESRAMLHFENGEKERLSVKLFLNTDKTTGITMTEQLQSEAEAAGAVPPSGKARAYLGNLTDGAVIFILDGRKFNIKKQNPGPDAIKSVPFRDLAPGKHAFTVTMHGKSPFKLTVEMNPDEAWGVIAESGEVRAIRMY